MNLVIEMVGNFILFFAGFVITIFSLALSVHATGIRVLRERYDSEKEQAIKNITEQMQSEGKDANVEATLQILKKKRKTLSKNLRYLSPVSLLAWTSTPFGIAFLLILVISGSSQTNVLPSFFFYGLWIALVSMIGCGIYIFFEALQSMLSASEAQQKEKSGIQDNIQNLLAAVADNTRQTNSPSTFVPKEDITVTISDEDVTGGGTTLTFSSNKSHTIKVILTNSSDLMLKQNELGIIFPEECLIERKDGDNITSVFADTKGQIVRFNSPHIHSHERNNIGSINVNFLKVGTFKANYFVKAENLIQKRADFSFKIIE